MFVDLGQDVYMGDFESRFLAATAEFYKVRCNMGLSSHRVAGHHIAIPPNLSPIILPSDGHHCARQHSQCCHAFADFCLAPRRSACSRQRHVGLQPLGPW